MFHDLYCLLNTLTIYIADFTPAIEAEAFNAHLTVS